MLYMVFNILSHRSFVTKTLSPLEWNLVMLLADPDVHNLVKPEFAAIYTS